MPLVFVFGGGGGRFHGHPLSIEIFPLWGGGGMRNTNPTGSKSFFIGWFSPEFYGNLARPSFGQILPAEYLCALRRILIINQYFEVCTNCDLQKRQTQKKNAENQFVTKYTALASTSKCKYT